MKTLVSAAALLQAQNKTALSEIEIWDTAKDEKAWEFVSTQRLAVLNNPKNWQHIWIRKLAKGIPYRR